MKRLTSQAIQVNGKSINPLKDLSKFTTAILDVFGAQEKADEKHAIDKVDRDIQLGTNCLHLASYRTEILKPLGPISVKIKIDDTTTETIEDITQLRPFWKYLKLTGNSPFLYRQASKLMKLAKNATEIKKLSKDDKLLFSDLNTADRILDVKTESIPDKVAEYKVQLEERQAQQAEQDAVKRRFIDFFKNENDPKQKVISVAYWKTGKPADKNGYFSDKEVLIRLINVVIEIEGPQILSTNSLDQVFTYMMNKEESATERTAKKETKTAKA